MEHSEHNPEGTSRRDVLKFGGLTALGSAVAGALVSTGSAAASVTSASVLGSRALRQNRFALEIDGVQLAGIHTVDIESDATLANDPTSAPVNTARVSRDWSNTSEWYKWRKAVLDGKVERKSVSIVFHHDDGTESGRLNLFNCWPSKWSGPSLNAKSSGHATEKMEISWETCELKTV